MRQRALPGLETPTVLTVGELAGAIQNVLERGLDRVWVSGEISNFKLHASGHCYFTLKDEEAQVPAVLFRSAASRLRFRPADGLEVLAFGQVRFYPPQGRLQLYVDSLEPRGVGALRAQLEELRRRLEAEGLLDPRRKRRLPFLPRCIGIVTAPGGAALRDMLRMISDRYPKRRIVVCPVRVQGLGAEEEIAGGIRSLQGVAEVEVIVVARGGGSLEDLWAFNDEGVARAIVASRVPVVSAVGHEIDVTIADLVADARAPTPTAVAELVFPKRCDLEQVLDGHHRSLLGGARRTVAACRRVVEALRARMRDPRRDVSLARRRAAESDRRLVTAFGRTIRALQQRVDHLERRLGQASPRRAAVEGRRHAVRAEERLVAAARRRLESERARVAGLSAALSGLSPLAVLARGYAVVRKTGSERVLRSSGEVAVGEDVDVRLGHGSLRATVTHVVSPDGEEDDRS